MEAFVDIITIITEDNADGFGANPPAQKFNKRVARNQNLQRRQDSQQHLRVISTANQQDINGVLGAALPNYLFDPLLGTGQTIYVVDSGARPSHSVSRCIKLQCHGLIRNRTLRTLADRSDNMSCRTNTLLDYFRI